MISNRIEQITKPIFEIPVMTRAIEEEGWVPTFELWQTTVDKGTSYIDCTGEFSKKRKNYAKGVVDPKIGYIDGNPDNGTLVINWRALIDDDSIPIIHDAHNGHLKVTTWNDVPSRGGQCYCTYLRIGKAKWLHRVVLESIPGNYVVHHINCVSADNRKSNLHILSKTEHDGINHPDLNERRVMFADPKSYYETRKKLAVNDFITQIGVFIVDDQANEFIARFAKENMALTREILEIARRNLNLSRIQEHPSENRRLNAHLNQDYLDAYEIEEYLKNNRFQVVPKGQIKLF